jgi:hypothetical protein
MSDCFTAAAVLWLLIALCMPTFGTGRVKWLAEEVLAKHQGTEGRAAQTNDFASTAKGRPSSELQ